MQVSELEFSRGIKGMLIGASVGAAVSTSILLALKQAFGVDDLLSGTITGAILGFVLKLSIPAGFPIPKDITTVAYLIVEGLRRRFFRQAARLVIVTWLHRNRSNRFQRASLITRVAWLAGA